MVLLILGLVLFIGTHAFTTRREARADAIARFGDGGYKGLYSLASLAGLVLISIGYGQYRAGGYVTVWDPPRFFSHITLLLMWFAMVSLAATYAPTGLIKSRLKHPMLTSVKIWALAHLLANGDLGSILLFGGLLAWAVYARIAAKRRGDNGPGPAPFGTGDIIALAVGTVAYGAFIMLHPYLIGVSVIPR